jgi:hypothetical protein
VISGAEVPAKISALGDDSETFSRRSLRHINLNEHELIEVEGTGLYKVTLTQAKINSKYLINCN